MGFGGQELTSCALAHGLPPWPHLGVRAQGGAGECSLEQGPGHGAGQGTAPGGRAPLPGFCWGDSGGRIESQSNRGLPGAARAEKPALSRAGFPHRQQKLGATPPRHVFRAGSKLRRYKEQTPSWCSGCCLSEGRGLAALPRWAAAAGSGELSKSGPSPSGAKLGLAWGTPGAQAVRAPPPPRREEDPRCSCGDRVMPGKEAAAGAAGGAAPGPALWPGRSARCSPPAPPAGGAPASWAALLVTNPGPLPWRFAHSRLLPLVFSPVPAGVMGRPWSWTLRGCLCPLPSPLQGTVRQGLFLTVPDSS
nr:orexin isoform X2 [Chrysemys picta bellii]